MQLTVHHRVPRADIALGLVLAEGLRAERAPEPLATALDRLIERRRATPLSPEEDGIRERCRDILRNGSYKPTGRGKPASEYLLRAATEGDFPRINGPVDANNLVSLGHLAPISLWDLDLAGTSTFEVRLGAAGESYVFNSAGQLLELRDLVCGCGLFANGRSRPMVTPIKDSLATKLTSATTRVAACIYWPLDVGEERLERATRELAEWLGRCGEDVRTALAVCRPGETAVAEVA